MASLKNQEKKVNLDQMDSLKNQVKKVNLVIKTQIKKANQRNKHHHHIYTEVPPHFLIGSGYMTWHSSAYAIQAKVQQ